MKTSNMTMTPIQIASSVIEKLQDENRISLDTLHKTQNEIKHLHRQLLEKEQLIKILEDRLRRGSNSFLEISNRQKEITIKHLELQIQKLLKENQDLDLQINSVKSDICAKCETKFLLGTSEDKKTVNRPLVKKSAKDLPGKNTSSQDSQNREKMLERIIEHKDKRILHLSKEVQKLLHVEKELTNKIYRLTKLLPMSQMPSEMLIECLLNEIKSLESQMQLNRGVDSIHKPKLCVKGVSILPSTSNPSMISENLKLCSRKNHTVSDFECAERENVTLVSNLHKLFSDVSELKQFFASENEKMHQNLTRNSIKNDALKIQWKEVINRVNDIAESINNVIKTNPLIKHCDSSNSMEKENVQRLQDMLKNSLELTSQYEEENAVLKANLEKLNEQFVQEQENLQYAETKIKQRSEELSRFEQNLGFCQDVSEILHLKELLKDKQRQLDSTENHLQTCQVLIQELQKLPKELNHHSTQTLKAISKQDATDAIPSDKILQLRSLERKLEVAEKNIKTCEDVIEELQNVIRNLEEENLKLDSDLHLAKLNKVVSDANNNQYIVLKTKLDETEDQLITVTNLNKDLQDKRIFLEEENTRLRADLLRTSSKSASLQDINDEKASLQTKLGNSEQTIGVLENNIVQLQTSIEKLKDENAELRIKIQSSENKQNMAETYEDDVVSLRNELILKEEEIQGLKESLQEFERKAFEMNHYRKTLRQEIEKLCDVLMEHADSSKTTANRKAIYNAAVLQSAQAILRLDADVNVRPEPAGNTDALEEMKNQVSVYLTEVARIHELLSLKQQQKKELLEQYLDLSSQIDLTGSSSHELFVQERPESNVESRPPLILVSGAVNTSSGTAVPTLSDTKGSTSSGTAVSTSSDAAVNTSSESGVHSASKNGRIEVKHVASNCSYSEEMFRRAQEDLEASKSITTYLLSKCSELEDLVEKERIQFAKYQSENESQLEVIESLKSQVNVKSNLMKRLNTLIDMMRSRECNDEITMEQLKSEIKWLVDENQKVFEKVTNTQSELCRCKEENSRVQNDLDTLKRQLVNEKYEHAKVNNELKHLRIQITHSQSSTAHDT